jgi:predicted transcriptional regulator
MIDLLASKVKIKILRFFFEFPSVKRNVREIARECKIGFGVASNALKDLKCFGIIKMETDGREILYSLNTNSKFFEPLKRIFEMEKEETNLPYNYRNLITDAFTATKKLAKSCFLLGSSVNGTSKDRVDLLFISNRKDEIRKKCSEIGKKYNLKLRVKVLRKEEIKNYPA